jgi:hypothetical protein
MITAKYTVGRCPHCGATLDQPPDEADRKARAGTRKVSAKERRERNARSARAEALREKFRALSESDARAEAPVEVDHNALARAEEIRRKFGLI